MSDLVGGRWPQYDPTDRILNLSNATQANVAARSNVYYTRISALTEVEGLATEKGLFVPVPVEYGDVISKVTVLLASKPVETAVKSFAAVYSGATKAKGKGKLLAQSKKAEATIPVTKSYTATLEKAVLITTENAPFGHVWVGLTAEYGAEAPKFVGIAVKTGAQYEYVPGAPEAYCVELAQKAAGEAAAEITIEGKSKETVPLTFLT